MDDFEAFLLKSRQSNFASLSSFFLNHQSATITAPNGTGKSIMFSQIFPSYLTQSHPDSFKSFSFSCLNSSFSDQIFDHSYSSQSTTLFIIDDLISDSQVLDHLPIWKHLWSQRSSLNLRLVFLFLAERSLNPSSFGPLGFCYLENNLSFTPLSLFEMTTFIKSISASAIFTPKLIKTIYNLSSANPRLVKILVKEVESGQDLDTLLSRPISSRLLFFFNQLQSVSGFSSLDLSRYYPTFTAYFQSGSSLDLSFTSLEKKLFDLLKANSGQIVSRDNIIKAVWGSDHYQDLYDHSLDQLAYRLKQKINHLGFNLSARKGRGFILS